TTKNGMMTVDMSPSSPTEYGGQGVNPDATTVFDDVFEIANQGTQPVGVWLDVAPVQNANGNPAIDFYRNGDRSTEIVGRSNAVCLDTGEKVCVGFVTRTYGLSPGDSLLAPVSNGSELLVSADASIACGGGGESPGMGGGTGGTPDPTTGSGNWLVTSLPEAADVKPHPTPPYSPFVVDPPGVWADSPDDAEWVDPFGDGGRTTDPSDADTPYVYELTFDVASERTLVVDAYGSDNPVELYLNGRKIGGSDGENAFQSLRSDVTDQTLAPGTYTLRAEVVNEPGPRGNPTGFLFDAHFA
ncbi:MAG: DUF1102 domain-containing protein, partial [Haloferacaceae archaeon]